MEYSTKSVFFILLYLSKLSIVKFWGNWVQSQLIQFAVQMTLSGNPALSLCSMLLQPHGLVRLSQFSPKTPVHRVISSGEGPAEGKPLLDTEGHWRKAGLLKGSRVSSSVPERMCLCYCSAPFTSILSGCITDLSWLWLNSVIQSWIALPFYCSCILVLGCVYVTEMCYVTLAGSAGCACF